ncbi:GNAT family N-acetyltransferase [Allomuricauda sp. d1]|uniref:GNAT family N-acetyltransferase n=1 Tax=Allomuricauda sp. d1 TaxID=3136725 RepID=UPI0031CFF8BF
MMDIKIVDYNDSYRNAFKALNQEWIEKYFKMEAMDHHYLDHPKENILEQGGYIVVALLGEEPIGVCALVKSNYERFDYELTKMGVSPKAQGKGIGYLLGKAIVDKARDLGANNIFIESHTVLGPALNLYKKLGFTVIEGVDSPYERSNIQMELVL